MPHFSRNKISLRIEWIPKFFYYAGPSKIKLSRQSFSSNDHQITVPLALNADNYSNLKVFSNQSDVSSSIQFGGGQVNLLIDYKKKIKYEKGLNISVSIRSAGFKTIEIDCFMPSKSTAKKNVNLKAKIGVKSRIKKDRSSKNKVYRVTEDQNYKSELDNQDERNGCGGFVAIFLGNSLIALNAYMVFGNLIMVFADGDTLGKIGLSAIFFSLVYLGNF